MSYDRLLEELRRENLCTHFILPLLKLNKVGFTSSNFVNSFISQDKGYIVVQVVDGTLLSRRVLQFHPRYTAAYELDGYLWIVYKLGAKWEQDTELFCRGEFSEMSDEAKDMIIRYSGLDWKKQHGTDGRLLALEKHPVLREMWEEVIEPREPIVGELLTVPPADSYIDLKRFEGLRVQL